MKALVVGLGLVGSLVLGAPALAHGRIINPGTPDAGIMARVHGHRQFVQLEYLWCIGARDVVWWEDGSCSTREQARAQWMRAQERALHPTGLTFVGHITATEDK